MDNVIKCFSEICHKLDQRFSQYATGIGIFFSILIGAVITSVNVSLGPLANLNDIGGWHNRFIFLILCGGAEVLVQILAVRLRPSSCGRMLVRQLILVCGFHIAMLAINQKTYYYSMQIQPLIRAAETGGLSVLADIDTTLSIPLLSFLFLLTRIPIYDMYLVKLFCIVSYQVLVLLFVHSMEKTLPGLRTEALLLLSVILPQMFLSVSCAAQADVFALLLIALALTLRIKGSPLLAAAIFGLSSSLCGVLLLAAPLFVFPNHDFLHLTPKGEVVGKKKQLTSTGAQVQTIFFGVAVFFYFIPMLPAILSGVPVGKAVISPLNALFGVPPYASGSPNLMSLFPRAAAIEMPEAFLLRHLPELDLETNASPFYSQAHFSMLMRSLALIGLAGYCSVTFYATKRIDGVRLEFILTMAALFVVPGGSIALWLICDLLALYLILTNRKMRIQACLLLFVTAAGSCYPVTEEILIRPAYLAMIMLVTILTSFTPQSQSERNCEYDHSENAFWR